MRRSMSARAPTSRSAAAAIGRSTSARKSSACRSASMSAAMAAPRPSATWRMDRHFDAFRSEVPHLKRRPSEYVKEHFWFTTQPIDEPDEAKHLRSLIEWVGADRLLFSSDYPHWDFDDPRFAFKTPLSEIERQKIFSGNARALYKL